MSLNTILTIFAVLSGVVALFELLEYIFTKNIPWLARLLRQGWRRLRRQLRRGKGGSGQRYLVITFSPHPLLPGQRAAIRAKTGWPALEVIDGGVGNVPEGQNFVSAAVRYLDRIDLLPAEWQIYPLVVVPAGYSVLWSAFLAELHGRLGYFPDLVRLRPAPAVMDAKYEGAGIERLRDVRNQALGKR